EQNRERIYNGAALNAPEHWAQKQYKLTMTMLDTFDYEDDDMHVIDTTIYRHMRPKDYTPDDIICGTVNISNETADKISDFTKAGLAYICKQAFNPQASTTT
ncbi:MAG: hypothetical protein ACKPKO_58325, partial [Candidatus Fonsibacter sp.]